MSRSRRKIPVIGIGGISEKNDKREYNRKLRREVKINLMQGKEIHKHIKEISDPWLMNKDGKMWFDPLVHPKLMRK